MRNRTWHPLPKPWRERISDIARIVDDIQRNVEISIGFRGGKQYFKKMITDVDKEGDAKKIVALLRLICPDCVRIFYFKNELNFSYSIGATFRGVAPKMKRTRIGGNKNA